MQESLVEYEILDLYGLYDHKIKINNEENTVIVHGPNGVGKTALLKSIKYLFAKNFEELSKIPFSRITARLNSGIEILVTRTGTSIEQLLQREKTSNHTIEIDLIKDRKTIASHAYIDDAWNHRISLNISKWIELSRQGLFFEDQTSSLASDDIDKYLFEHARNLSKPRKSKIRKNLEIIDSTLNSVEVHFVETNRLYRQQPGSLKQKETTLIPTVKDCANQLILHIGSALKDYGRKSQELDQSFPYRFIFGSAIDMPADDIKDRLTELTKQSNRLKELGILDSESLQQFDVERLDAVPPYKLEMMGLHIKDSEEKLAVFDSLSNRADLLLKSLSKKFRNKKISISKERGLIAEGPRGLDIELDALSSGEQHEIVLLYELLFKVSKNTLVLIDEPELSLHVNWQKAFLPELLSIAKEVGFSSIVATHSPFIVGSRSHLMTPLDSSSDE